MAKLWEAGKPSEGSEQMRREALDPIIERFLSSLAVDARLVFEDIECSQAHAIMLGEQGVLAPEEAGLLVDTLAKMRKELEAGSLQVDPDAEDVHSFLEEELTRRLGDIGKAIHAGRSRNDQVAVAFKLHVRNACHRTENLVKGAIGACLDLAQQHTETLMPGYTHLQRAQPVTLAHHLMAWCAALERDVLRFHDAGRCEQMKARSVLERSQEADYLSTERALQALSVLLGQAQIPWMRLRIAMLPWNMQLLQL